MQSSNQPRVALRMEPVVRRCVACNVRVYGAERECKECRMVRTRIPGTGAKLIKRGEYR